jgi:hypothetical protein
MENYQKTLSDIVEATASSSEFETLIKEFQYQGFDPIEMAKVLSDLAKANKRNLKADVVAMLTLAVTRGTNIDKVVKKMGQVGITKVQSLKSAYSISSSSKGQGPSTVSLSRVVATFPQGAAILIIRNPDSNKRLAALNTALPAYLCFPGANALIPKTGEYAGWHAEYEKFAEEFSKLVGSKQTEKERANFIDITKKSPITGEDPKRGEYLKYLIQTNEGMKVKREAATVSSTSGLSV